jgi:hypothetical protein
MKGSPSTSTLGLGGVMASMGCSFAYVLVLRCAPQDEDKVTNNPQA